MIPCFLVQPMQLATAYNHAKKMAISAKGGKSFCYRNEPIQFTADSGEFTIKHELHVSGGAEKHYIELGNYAVF